MRQGIDFLTIGAEDIVFASAKIGVDLTWEDRILRNVSLATVFVQWEDEQPGDSGDDAEEGEVWGELE